MQDRMSRCKSCQETDARPRESLCRRATSSAAIVESEGRRDLRVTALDHATASRSLKDELA